jgi:hypothetical protein
LVASVYVLKLLPTHFGRIVSKDGFANTPFGVINVWSGNGSSFNGTEFVTLDKHGKESLGCHVTKEVITDCSLLGRLSLKSTIRYADGSMNPMKAAHAT